MTNADAPFGFTGSGVDGAQGISWTADSRTLAFGVKNTSYIGVRLLDTTAGGTDLIADGRLVVIERKFTDPGRSLRNAGRSALGGICKRPLLECAELAGSILLDCVLGFGCL